MKGILVTTKNLKKLINCKIGDKISLDLDYSFVQCDEKIKQMIETLPKKKIKDGFIYFWDGRDLIRLDCFDEHYFKLRQWNKMPILEIDGLRMHLVKEFKEPIDYARKVVSLLNIKKDDLVLDTCFGLGYLALMAVKRGAKVVAVEKYSPVIELAKFNPWSKEVIDKVELYIGPVEEVLKKEKKIFDKIIHDPPRISHAPFLYSRSFYTLLAEHARPGTLLYHYVGSVGKMKGRHIDEEVKKRLEECGWKIIKEWKRGQALVARLD